ncbi:hypothetical protein ACVWW3_008210 [Bradyrhizobium sp. LM2.9]
MYVHLKRTSSSVVSSAVGRTALFSLFFTAMSVSFKKGKRDEFEAVAVKEVFARQIEQAMRENNISRNNPAQHMKTWHSQIGPYVMAFRMKAISPIDVRP